MLGLVRRVLELPWTTFWFRIKIGIMLKTGYVKSDEEYQNIDDYFNRHIAKFDENKFGFREKYWYYNANLWRSFLVQDFLSCYKFAHKWVTLFYDNPSMISFL